VAVLLVHRSRANAGSVLALVPVLLLALVIGMLAGTPTGDVPPVYAAYCTQPANYPCGDGRTTSALAVTHHTSPGHGTSTVVEPDTGETWAITAQWCPTAGGQENLEYAYATVSWSGSQWQLSNVTLSNNIVGVSICQGDTCDAGGGAVHSRS